MIGLGYFDSETAASSTFGSVVCLAGIIGTPLGGLLLDYGINKSKIKDENEITRNMTEYEALSLATDRLTYVEEIENKTIKSTLKCVTKIITIASLFGAIFLCSVYFIYDRFLYLFLVTLGCLLVFLCNPGVNIGIMMAVPEKNR